MRNSMRLLTAGVLGLAVAAPAMAEPFATASYARTSTGYDDISAGNGFALGGGWVFDPYRLFVEAEYLHSGQQDFKDTDGYVKYDGGQFYGGYLLDFRPFLAWFKAGGYVFDGKTDASSGTESGFAIGFGADYLLSRDWGVRLDVDLPFKVDVTPGAGGGQSTDITVVKVGVVWRPSRSRSSDGYAAPAAQVGSTRNMVPPAPQAKTRAQVWLRGAPRRDAALGAQLPQSTVVSVGEGVRVSGRNWWDVSTADGDRGWIADDDLAF